MENYCRRSFLTEVGAKFNRSGSYSISLVLISQKIGNLSFNNLGFLLFFDQIFDRHIQLRFSFNFIENSQNSWIFTALFFGKNKILKNFPDLCCVRDFWKISQSKLEKIQNNKRITENLSVVLLRLLRNSKYFELFSPIFWGILTTFWSFWLRVYRFSESIQIILCFYYVFFRFTVFFFILLIVISLVMQSRRISIWMDYNITLKRWRRASLRKIAAHAWKEFFPQF